jgi:hypothetical protein
MRVRQKGSRHTLAWVVSLVIALLGCTSSIPEGQCEFDVHCGGGQVCVDHYCRATCRQDSD